MRTTTSIALLATAGLAVFGCRSVTTDSFGPHCTAAPTCPVTLAITANGAACQISPPGTITVLKGSSPIITWELRDGTNVGYQFPRNGIEFVTKPDFPKSPPDGVFQVLGPGPATTFRVKDTHRDDTTVGRFNYKITVVKPDGSPGCQLDPPIYNGP
ncbi:MAG TPA: hypothetical protein VFJ62_03250 [Usitatibacter sp.]|nr:hypothetical protein [Usitatibacter sp.]